MERSCLEQLMDFRRAALSCHPDFHPSPESQEHFRSLAYDWLRHREPSVLLWNGREESRDGESLPAFAQFSLARALSVFAAVFSSPLLLDRLGHSEALCVPVPLRLTDTLLGSFKTLQVSCREVCPDCSGTGRVPAGECACCTGDGSVVRAHKVRFEIVPGAMSGNAILLPGEGEYQPRQRHRGDLLLVLQEQLPPGLHRDGANVETGAEVDALVLAVGGTAEVLDLLGASLPVRIPPGVLEGAVVRVSGHGLPSYNRNGRGDLLLRLKARFPKDLCSDEIAFLRRMYEKRRTPLAFPTIQAGHWKILELTSGQEHPGLEEDLPMAIAAALGNGSRVAVDVRSHGTRISEYALSALLRAYHKLQGQEKQVLLGVPGLNDYLAGLRLASLFTVVDDVASLEKLDPLEPALPARLGKWQCDRLGPGALGSSSLPEHPEWLAALEPSGNPFRLLDISRVGSVDSYFLGCLMQLYRYTRDAHGQVALLGVSEAVRKVLLDTNTLSLFTLVDSADALDY